MIDQEVFDSRIFDICEAADAEGVGLTAWREEAFVWISEINRDPSAPAGAGAKWLCALRDTAHDAGLPVQLCCTAFNSQLIAYYARHGFRPIYEEGEEVFLEAPVPAASPDPSSPDPGKRGSGGSAS